MTITLCPLPYAEDALEPHISSRTLKIHHGAHHKGYVDKTNDGVAGTDLADADLNDIVIATARSGDGKLFNSAAQTWNHGFYWNSLAVDGGSPSAALQAAIEKAFGSIDDLKSKLVDEAVGHFASGWAWLVAEGDALKVISTHDAATPITGAANPLLTIDVWEHAYYLDVQNKRPEYVKAVVSNLLNWTFASENFARGSAWKYPS